MASIKSIRDGLRTRLRTITGLATYDTEPGSAVYPAAVVELESISFDSTMDRGSDDFVFLIRLFTSSAANETGIDKLDGYCATSGASSIKAAIEGDQTLGGIVHFARVAEARDYRIREYAGSAAFSIEFVVEVCASGS